MGNTTNLITEVTDARTLFLSASDALLSYFSSFSSSTHSFVSLVEKIEMKARELKEREEKLEMLEEGIARKKCEMESMFERKNKELDDKKAMLEKREKEMEKRASLVLELEKKWNEEHKRTQENATNLIQLNVGGQCFALPKATLLQHKGSFFATMLTHSKPFEGAFYIDYSPKYFSVIADFLKTGKVQSIGKHNEKEIREYFEYFLLPYPAEQVAEKIHKETTVNPMREIKLFQGGDLVHSMLQEPFQDWLPNTSFSLIYKATRDGFTTSNFLPKCHKKGPTLCIIKSKFGYLFGGYTSTPLNYILSSSCTSFLFTLTNPYNIPPTKYLPISNVPIGARCGFFGLMVFGRGTNKDIPADIYVVNDANTRETFIGFPQSYQDTTGKGPLTFTGHPSYLAADIEVYLVLKNTK